MNLAQPLLTATALSSRGLSELMAEAEGEVEAYYIWLTVKRLVQEAGYVIRIVRLILPLNIIIKGEGGNSQ